MESVWGLHGNRGENWSGHQPNQAMVCLYLLSYYGVPIDYLYGISFLDEYEAVYAIEET